MLMLSSIEKNFKLLNKVETISLPIREEIEDKYKWDLTHIYSENEEWEKDFTWIERNLNGYDQFKGKLNSGADTLLACLRFDDSMAMKLERLYLYAMLAKDRDLRDNTYQAMDDRIKSLYTKVSAISSFIKPELLEIDSDDLLKMIESNNELNIYKHNIDDLLRTKVHSLSKQEEQILALASEIAQTPYNSYSMFTNADLKFPMVKDDNGKNVEISHGRFYAAMYSNDRDYRERAFKAYLTCEC